MPGTGSSSSDPSWYSTGYVRSFASKRKLRQRFSGLLDAHSAFGGLDEHGRLLPHREAEVGRGILGDRGRDDLITAVELHLHDRHHAAEFDLGDGPFELISGG